MAGYFVDAHSHIWTTDTERYPWAAGVTAEDGSFTTPSWTAEELLTAGAEVGVRRAVLISHGGIYSFDNSYMCAALPPPCLPHTLMRVPAGRLDAAAAHPEQLRVVGAIDVEHLPPTEVAAQMRELLPRRVTGFRLERLGDKGDPSWLQSEGAVEMWRTAAETKQAVCLMMHPPDLPHVSDMCERFPDTVVVIDHMSSIGENKRFGGTGIIEPEDTAALVALARHPNVYVKVSAFYALGTGEAPYLELLPLIRALIAAFGCERLMWATDSPYQSFPPGIREGEVGPGSYAASLALVKDALDGLSERERDWLLRRTAEKVYFGDDGGERGKSSVAAVGAAATTAEAPGDERFDLTEQQLQMMATFGFLHLPVSRPDCC